MPQYSGVWNLAQQAQALTQQQWVTDPLFDYTTLLLQADNAANGAQNNTFLDSSSNAFAVTRNGNTTQGTFSPFSLQPGAWGNYFNGSTDYITTSNANFAMGTSNFTVECWVYLTAYPSSTDGYIATWLNNSGNGFWIGTNSSTGQLAGYVGQGASGDGIAAGVVPLNTWAHTALTRNGSTLTLWLNGVAVGSTTTTRSLDRTPLAIGSTYSSSIFTYKTTGYVSNARVVSGQCLYTGTFTPSTAPFTTTSVGSTGPGAASSLTGTVTLLTSQSNRFIDNSASANTLTISGTPSVQAFSPFAPQFQYTASGTGGSGYFDGNADYLTVTGSGSAFTFGTGDFTIEAFVYPTTTGSGSQFVYWQYGNSIDVIGIYYDASTKAVKADLRATNLSSTIVTASNTIFPSAWNHIALVRSGGTNIYLYLNGVRTSTTIASNASFNEGQAGFFTQPQIGAQSNPIGSYCTCYISNFRTVKGTAVYTGATLTVPTAPLTAITNTQLLLNFTNAGILDGTMKNNLETVGNASVSTSVVKYGSGSMYNPGTTGSYLTRSVSSQLFVFPGDFTIEFWAWKSANGANAYDTPVSCDNDGNATNGWALELGTVRYMYFVVNGATFSITSSAINPNDSTWHHYAVCRSGSTIRLFRDGVQIGSGTYSATIGNSSIPALKVFAYGNTTTNSFNGYIDDLRITNGFARYTRNFTPPQVALPRQ
jgi:hypothetical protein